MGYTYTPAYYSSLHDTITSLCKTILPFSLKKRQLPVIAAEHKLAKQQSENLKWQQESFHRILNLIGLQKEGILAENEVSAFRSHLLDTLIASPAEHEQPAVIRDKLQFLQELFYANCISKEDYHSSKRPLLQRLAVQGAEVSCKDVIFAGPTTSEEEWSVIELKDEPCSTEKDTTPLKYKAKHRSPLKQIKGAVSMIGIATPYKSAKSKENKVPTNSAATSNMFESFKENPFWETPSKTNDRENRSILMTESSPLASVTVEKERDTDKVKKKAFRSLFQKEQSEGPGGDRVLDADDKVTKSTKKQWSFDGFKKWKKSNGEDESTMPYLPPGERSDDVSSSDAFTLVASPIGEGPNTKLIKKKIHTDGSASDFFIDKVLGENIKKELSRIQTELNTSNPSLNFTNEQIDAISTRLPVDKADLKKFFPKTWCDRYGEIVLDVVRKEFKDHVGEMESLRNATREKHGNSARWVAFEDDNDENFHSNLFSKNHQGSSRQPTSINKGDSHVNNPFRDASYENQNPFWNPRGFHTFDGLK